MKPLNLVALTVDYRLADLRIGSPEKAYRVHGRQPSANNSEWRQAA